MQMASEFLARAYHLGSTSPDTSTQIGAVVVSEDGDVIGDWQNRPPIGVQYTPERCEERPIKYEWMEHAEAGSLLIAARSGRPTINSTMYAYGAACAPCSRSIVMAGVKKLVVHKEYMDNFIIDRWRESVDRGWEMMREAGVFIEEYSGPIDAPSVRVDGKYWSPMYLSSD